MKIILDTDEKKLIVKDDAGENILDLYSDAAFQVLSQQWLKVGWNQKYPYAFSWLGRPIIQIPEDIIRLQEVIYRLQPDVILETGIAHGGSLIFHAGLCKIINKGRVIGIDIEIRPHNRNAIESHSLFPYITLIEGSSIENKIIAQAKSLIAPGETVLVILDSCHTKAHVAQELEAYHDLVTPGSYIVATDGSMESLDDVPRGHSDWKQDNPASAAREFVARHPEFIIEQPAWPFNESTLNQSITHWPDAWIKKL